MGLSSSFAPLLPPWLLILLAALALALVAPLLLRRRRGGGLRALGLGLGLVALANPMVHLEDRRPLSTIVALVVDTSQSQAFGNRNAITQEARHSLEQQIAAFKDVELRLITSGNTADRDGTLLFDDLRRGLADVPPERLGGVILLTDGQVHDIPAPDASALDAPLHALITGTTHDRDRRLILTQQPRYALIGQSQPLSFRVEDKGTGGATARLMVTLRRDGEEIERRTVETGREITLHVPIPHAGPNVIEIEAEPLASELTTLNNRGVVVVDGIREKLRVLLVSGEPHAGERTWRNLLKADAQVDLVHFTILRPPEKQDSTPINELSLIAFPTRELFVQKIREFDLIIFDRYAQQGILPLSYFENMADYVRGGGAILVAAGPEHASSSSIHETALEAILPLAPTGEVKSGPFRPTLSGLGQKHPVTRHLPGSESNPPLWGRWHRHLEAAPDHAGGPAGQTLMEGPDKAPLLTLSRVEEGRTAIIMSDQIWLWARGYDGGGPHRDLMRRLAHWLMKEPELEEESLKLSARGSTLAIARQTLAEDTDAVILTSPTGVERRVTLEKAEAGLWKRQETLDELGLWQAQAGEMKRLIHIGPANPREFADVTSSTALLAPLARALGGSSQRIADKDALALPRPVMMRDSNSYAGPGWIGLRQREASVITGLSLWPLMAGLAGFLLLFGAVLAAWVRESR